MIALMLICLLPVTADETYTLLLTNNKRMVVQKAPECSGTRCTVLLLSGEKTSLPAGLIDLDRSREYNAEMARKKAEAAAEAERLAAEEEARLAKEQEKLKDKRVVLTADDKLPEYQRTAGISGVVEDEVDSQQQGDPVINNFTSDNPVYVAREILTRYNTHSELQCNVAANSDIPVQKIQVKARISFDRDAPVELTQSLGQSLSKGEMGSLFFRIESTDEVLRISYEVQGTVTEEVSR